MQANRWFPGITAGAGIRLRLFCFPHAGGGISPFIPWRPLMPAGIALCPVRLPGRESRIREPPCRRIGDLVTALALAIRPWLNAPYAFFGHSLGALVAFELSRELRRIKGEQPIHLFVSGARAPHCPARETTIAGLDDSAFIRELQHRFGARAIAAGDPEVLQLLVPALRADFEAIEQYVYGDEPPLACPITCFAGAQDPHATRDELQAWRRHTSGVFETLVFPGDHFFAYDECQEIPRHLSAALGGR